MRGIYKFNLNFGKRGHLCGLFIAGREYVAKLIESGIEIYFGDVLGRRSNISAVLSKDDITLITDDPVAVAVVEKYELWTGVNPFGYTALNFDYMSVGIDAEEEEDEEEIFIEDIIEKMLKI